MLLSLTGCHAVDNVFCSGAGCDWTKEEWARVQSLSNVNDTKGLGLPELPDEYPPSNAFLANPATVELGRMFYFDPRFSGPATLNDSIGRPVPYARAAKGTAIGIACADCHNPARAGGDFTSQPNTVSIGAGWYDVNGQQTVNAAFFADINGPFRGGKSRLYWNGRTETLWAQAAQVNESSFSMNGDRNNTFWVILEDSRYLPMYNDIFLQGQTRLDPANYSGSVMPRHARPDSFNATLNDAWLCMSGPDRELVTRTQINFGKAIEAYERTLFGGNSAFDRFVKEGTGSDAISPAAKRGARLFVGKASCIDCHNGYLLSDGDFHDIGVPQTGDHVPTVGDCPHGSARCDCTPGAETSTCAPAGAWAGWKKLVEGGVEKVEASRFATTSFTRNSEWSDSKPDVASTYCVQTDPSYKGAWRTPSLRDVANTAPYMHDGYYKTLEDVVWHYNNGGTVSGSDPFAPPYVAPSDADVDAGGGGGVDAGPPDGGIQECPQTGRPRGRAVQIKPLGLTNDEVSDLVEFLKTLTSTSVSLPDAAFDAGASPDVGGTPMCSSMDGGTQ
ncbi:MAG TPA: cytochrome c peroxidase [Polyangia bacterium]|nr:cytochrome c peroxidase [Polyangia bacterium]